MGPDENDPDDELDEAEPDTDIDLPVIGQLIDGLLHDQLTLFLRESNEFNLNNLY